MFQLSLVLLVIYANIEINVKRAVLFTANFGEVWSLAKIKAGKKIREQKTTLKKYKTVIKILAVPILVLSCL